MAKLYLMQTGQTTFEAQSRVESAAGAPLTPEGVQQVQDLARKLADERIDVVYASQAESEKQSAHLVAKLLDRKVRNAPNLREIDYGLWQGLTLEELKRRQPKVYRQWTEAPLTVCPPGGETMEQAAQRLRQALKGIVKRHKDETLLLVLRPVAMGLLRCALEGQPDEDVWQQVDCELNYYHYETDGAGL